MSDQEWNGPGQATKPGREDVPASQAGQAGQVSTGNGDGSARRPGPPGRRNGPGKPARPPRWNPGSPGSRRNRPGSGAKPGRLSAPGRLATMDGLKLDELELDGLATAELAVGQRPDEPLGKFAVRHGLKPSGARPSLLAYLTAVWQRRHFILGFATARNIAMYTDARLGQLWQVLTPLLNAGVYFFVFGVLLGTRRGIPDYLPFLVTGVFVFTYTQRSVIMSSRVMRDSLPLIRALHFPRACLPLGYVVIELEQLLLSFAVLIVIVLATGEPLTWYWLLVLPALVLQTMFNIGLGLVVARWGSSFDDVSQLLPFVVRTWMYISGVIFSIQTLALTGRHSLLDNHPGLSYALQVNPAAVFISLIRYGLLGNYRASLPGAQPFDAENCATYRAVPMGHEYLSAYCHPSVSTQGLWYWGIAWAVVMLIVGFIFFWRAEVRYGRG